MKVTITKSKVESKKAVIEEIKPKRKPSVKKPNISDGEKQE